MDNDDIALEAIRKKLVGKKLTYQEIYAVMDEIAKSKLGDILTTYFVASGYSKGFSKEEIYFLTKAMVETGEKIHFPGIVADKHSIGGTPGGRVSMIIVPIVAAAGFKIPKSSSRAITTPAGTADAMEVLSKVTFTKEEIINIVKKTNGCIVWGGSFKIAPADDEIIKVEEPLLFESYDKIIVSVMAKKVAFGSNHVVIDLPYGKTAKVHRISDAQDLEKKFEYIASKFGIRIKVLIRKAEQPIGYGIGPLLEAVDVLKVLEQKSDRPKELEEKALAFSSSLLELCLSDSSENIRNDFKRQYENTYDWAKHILTSGFALSKMKEIIKAQQGNPNITSEMLKPGTSKENIISHKIGKVSFINNKSITVIAKILGAPEEKGAGLYLNKKLGDKVEKNDILFTMYAKEKYNIREAIDSLDHFPIYEIG